MSESEEPADPVDVAGGAAEAAEADDQGWQRLDARMLLVGPVEAVKQFAIPVIVAIVGISSSQGGFSPVTVAFLALPVLAGVLPWLTTRFRITDTQFQLHKGLLNRQQLTAPLDRVRSVDLEASLMHRILGLTKVKVGTGVDDTRIELNALSTFQAEQLRHYVLARSPVGVGHPARTPGLDVQFASDGGGAGAGEGDSAPVLAAYDAPQLLATIDWSWLRFAPFSLSKLAIVAGAIGALAQWGDALPFFDRRHLDEAWNWALGFTLWLVVVSALLGGLFVWLVISITGYVIQWWNLRLTRERGTIHLTAGALTTRSTSVEEARVRGVEMTEPVLLRLVKGGELATLATGVGSGGVTTVLPPCPREVCQQVGHAVLSSGEALVQPLAAHGPLARRRCHTRHQRLTLVATVAAIVAAALAQLPWWVPVLVAVAFALLGVLLATLQYRHLGHLLTDHHLVAGSGSLTRRRKVLQRDGVIGWVISQTFFQRRVGLATLIATTAAGDERLVVLDLPLDAAVALAHRVTPDAVVAFTVPVPAPTGPSYGVVTA
ncbi:MAG: PH domain-containing protein [Nocardioidaceae bacterium]|nr:PH domain-containing protein [Nocardioidaceae bacterium]